MKLRRLRKLAREKNGWPRTVSGRDRVKDKVPFAAPFGFQTRLISHRWSMTVWPRQAWRNRR